MNLKLSFRPWLLMLGFGSLFVSPFSSLAHPASLGYLRQVISGVGVHLIQIDLRDKNLMLVPVVASGGIGHDEDFESMAKRAGALAAINGCYFDKHTKKPVGDIYYDRELINFGGFGATFGIKEDGEIEFSYIEKWTHKDWSGFKMGLTCIPYLVRDGEIRIKTQDDLLKEGFTDSHVFMKMPRSAFCIKENGKLLFISVQKGIYINTFAGIVKQLGCHNAIGLDGGASVGLFFNGKTIIRPGRKLTNLLVIKRKKKLNAPGEGNRKSKS